MSGNDPPRRAQAARFQMERRWLLPLGVVETQEFFAVGVTASAVITAIGRALPPDAHFIFLFDFGPSPPAGNAASAYV